MAELKYKHFFTVKDGKFIFDDKEMLDFVKRQLEGKKGYAIIEEAGEDISSEQYGYYFAGIIRAECMKSNTFAGLTETEIHYILLSELRANVVSFVHPKKGPMIKIVTPDIRKWSKKKMAEYITEVIALLQTEYDIHPKPPKSYKYNKYYIDIKTLK